MTFWISVLDQLPDDNRQVMVCSMSKKGALSYKTGYYGDVYGWVTQGTAEVVAWAEIPPYAPGGDPPTLEAAIEDIRTHYQIAKDNKWIDHPLAWAIYRVWKKVDQDGIKSKQKEKNDD